ncbi:hypothetical protein OPKNFCMD_6196 [Methylobacterium crusticola]|uniref:N-acetyltransferase domain-containing protein n=1 Tax=Methylobacterium crusticola TaxID=1697972 RepID=A0ABQ4R9H0_9HYPH|nr:N-acetyltransferase [Methylobacterium crusticola]GJD53421.1 hypothetical protein OPKNFCMD_6196 [Methylobacterium crusticola]
MHDDSDGRRFALTVDGQTVSADYERRPGILVIRYVYAPPALRGTGAAGRLMEEVAAAARAEDRRILALCGYARRWLARHPRHRALLA